MRRMWAAFGVADLPQTPFWQYGVDGYVRLNAENLAAASRAAQGAAWLGAVRGDAPTGLAARLRPPAVIRRTEAEVQATLADATALNARLFDWRQWVSGLRWTQADLLQVMEELEPNAQAALQSYFTLRAGLEAAHTRTGDAGGAPRLLVGLTGLPSVEAVRALAVLNSFGPSGPAYDDYLVRYGHRGARAVTPTAARWQDHPERLRLALEAGAGRDLTGAPNTVRGQRDRGVVAAVSRACEGRGCGMGWHRAGDGRCTDLDRRGRRRGRGSRAHQRPRGCVAAGAGGTEAGCDRRVAWG